MPVWGYEDESKPEVMEKKIDAAADHGIDHFIFDWYHYEDGPYLERCLEQGFLKARNVDRIDFALMWANHDWVNVHPMSRAFGKELLYPGKVSPKVFRFITDLIVDRYFSHPSYLKVEGCPYFSIYDLGQFVATHGSVEATRKAIDAFRERVRSAGFPDLHFNAVVWGKPVLPGEKVIRDLPQLITALGFDSVTSYVWIHHVELDETPFTPFQKVLKKYLQVWDRMEEQYNIPYFPNITMGWDNSPRTLQSDIWGPLPESTFSNCIGGNTPEAFQEALEIYRKRLSQRVERMDRRQLYRTGPDDGNGISGSDCKSFRGFREYVTPDQNQISHLQVQGALEVELTEKAKSAFTNQSRWNTSPRAMAFGE
jgi:hypothetical protein